MRRIKLRAWHIGNKQVSPVLGWKRWNGLGRKEFGVKPWLSELEGFNLLIDLTENILEWVGPHEIEVMQFAGLNDKNGKDACNGDIVK